MVISIIDKNELITGTKMPIPEIPLIELVRSSYKYREDKIAILYKDMEISYQKMAWSSYRIANLILESIGQKKGVVCVDLNRDPNLVYVILATQILGCTYLPLSRDMPMERNTYMVNDANPILIITDSLGRRKFGEKYKYLDINSSSNNLKKPNIHLEMSDISYIMYTSGSTGNPKGVEIDQTGICNSLLWKKNYYKFSQYDTLLFKAPINYDISMWEIFLPLISGGTLSIAEPGAHASSFRVCETIKKHSVTFIHIVPEMLRELLKEPGTGSIGNLTTIVCGGEAWYYPLAKLCGSVIPSANLYNGYGPTEASVGVTVWKYDGGRHEKLPIGKPIANVHLLIVDSIGIPVKKGDVGELMIGGISVSPGYVNKSRDKSLESKFFTVELTSGDKIRFYKTGDLVRQLSDDNIEFIGRADNQVKVNGTRIELEEIDCVVSGISEIQNVASVYDRVSKRIFVYYTPKISGKNIDDLILTACKKNLPGPVVPTKITMVEELPLSVNGKVDRDGVYKKYC